MEDETLPRSESIGHAPIKKRHRDYISSWAWLIALAVYGAYFLISMVSSWSYYSYSLLDRTQLPLFNLSIIVLTIIFVVAALRWKKWGAFGIYAITAGGYVIAAMMMKTFDNQDASLFDSIFLSIGLSLLFVTVMLIDHRKPFESPVKRQNAEPPRIGMGRRIFIVSWVVFLLLSNSFWIGAECDWDLRRGAGLVLILSSNSLDIVFALVSLTLRKWGFVGLGSLFLVTFVPPAVLFAGQGLPFAVGLYLGMATLGIVVLVKLLRPIWRQLKWR
jgi:hypothetical protein